MAELIQDIEVVLFDAVGTLLRPMPSVVDVYHAMGMRFGSRLTKDEINQRFRNAIAVPRQGVLSPNVRHSSDSMPSDHDTTDEETEYRWWRAVVARVFDDLEDAHERLFRELWDHFADGRNWELFGDVVPTWQWLKRRGHVVGIASNFDRRIVSVCRRFPILRDCRNRYWSADLRYAKPSRFFYQAIQSRLGVNAERIMLVGDDEVNDYQGAKAAGWRSLLLDRHGVARDIPEQRVVRTLDQLRYVLR